LIIDNANDIEMLYSRANKSTKSSGSPALADYLLFSRKGLILFTARSLEATVKQAKVDAIIVKEMSKGDSQELLQRSLINKSLIRKEDVIAKLLNNLTHLLLVIKQAAAYINKNTMSVSDYLGLYEANDKDLITYLAQSLRIRDNIKRLKILLP
jgi:hypothetical protein